MKHLLPQWKSDFPSWRWEELRKTLNSNYDINKLENGAFELVIPVPGFGKEDLAVTLEGRDLKIKNTNKWSAANEHNGIDKYVDFSFALGGDYKVDMCTWNKGLLVILLSKVIPDPKSNQIQIL